MKGASCGLEICCPVEICGALKWASDHGFEFVCLPLVHPRFKREFTAKWRDRSGPFTRPDMVLTNRVLTITEATDPLSCFARGFIQDCVFLNLEWNSLITAKVSPYLNIESEFLNGQGKFALEQELSYGGHLDVPAVIIPLRSSRCCNLARTVNSGLLTVKSFQVWLEIPMISHERRACAWRSDLSEEDLGESTWEWWKTFNIFCNSDKRLGIILEITNVIPNDKELKRWLGEPIRCLVISTTTFLTNKTGYPVLPKVIQSFIKALVPADVQVIIRGNNHHHGLDCYRKYIDHLWQEANTQENSQPEIQPSEKNIVQFPLKLYNNYVPLIWNNLQKYSVKYAQYAKAVHQAILDQAEENKTEAFNIMLNGAGKGQMILALLGAAAKCDQKVKIYAVEHNPHDVVVLQAYQAEFWQDEVTIIFEDIKLLKFPPIIDLIVSESQGSFGDDDLSPEFIDLAQKFLKRGGISIPHSYTSYICPAQSTKVYRDLRENNNGSDCDVPYCITQKQAYNISPLKSLFSFHHPNYSESVDNSRYKSLSFEAEQNCVLHGFAGFFEVVLYKDIKLSLLPHSYNLGNKKWNPVFFPLMNPVHLKPGDEIEVHFWRHVGKTKVWYEWTITKPVPLPMHNPNGRSSSMDLP